MIAITIYISIEQYICFAAKFYHYHYHYYFSIDK